jgi:23S rRNA (uracil1939-C5)-methyltransferase
MSRRKKPIPILENVEILDAGSEGKALARVDNIVVFVPFVVPGDIVDIRVTRRKRSYYEGKAIKFHRYSKNRIEPKCEHFGLCGGCKWQIMPYSDQLKYKQKQVVDNFERIGKLDTSGISPILPTEQEYFYRNKLEFTFSNRKWLTEEEMADGQNRNMNGLGFHLPGMFDRVIDVKNCYLQAEPSNSIRLALKKFATDNQFTFYDTREHKGFLRNVIIRTSSTGELMVIVIFAQDNDDDIRLVLGHLKTAFPKITSLMWVINKKLNDTIFDQEVHLFHGNPFIVEEMEGLKFKVGPKSFYQTNSAQAYNLYKTARDFAGFKGDETVYDLYCGTGTITNFVAQSVSKVVGIEIVPDAIEDAKHNSELNGITNTCFFAGDLAKLLDADFIAREGAPDIVITDPPRAGMHAKVIDQLLIALPEKIVYVSCNPSTQARDIDLLREKYELTKIQPVDMFPQTHHVENVCLLVRKVNVEL